MAKFNLWHLVDPLGLTRSDTWEQSHEHSWTWPKIKRKKENPSLTFPVALGKVCSCPHFFLKSRLQFSIPGIRLAFIIPAFPLIPSACRISPANTSPANLCGQTHSFYKGYSTVCPSNFTMNTGSQWTKSKLLFSEHWRLSSHWPIMVLSPHPSSSLPSTLSLLPYKVCCQKPVATPQSHIIKLKPAH